MNIFSVVYKLSTFIIPLIKTEIISVNTDITSFNHNNSSSVIEGGGGGVLLNEVLLNGRKLLEIDGPKMKFNQTERLISMIVGVDSKEITDHMLTYLENTPGSIRCKHLYSQKCEDCQSDKKCNFIFRSDDYELSSDGKCYEAIDHHPTLQPYLTFVDDWTGCGTMHRLSTIPLTTTISILFALHLF